MSVRQAWYPEGRTLGAARPQFLPQRHDGKEFSDWLTLESASQDLGESEIHPDHGPRPRKSKLFHRRTVRSNAGFVQHRRRLFRGESDNLGLAEHPCQPPWER